MRGCWARRNKSWKAIFVCLLLNFFFSSLLAASERQGTFELYFGNLDIKEPRFKAVYQKGGPIRGVVLSASLIFGLDFYMEIKEFDKVGALTYTKEETKFYLFPFSFGVRYILPSPYIRPYFGGGGDFYFYYETNTIGSVFNFAKGYHLLGGVYFQLGKKIPIQLNLRVKYTQVKVERSNFTLELGGIDYGGGVAIIF